LGFKCKLIFQQKIMLNMVKKKIKKIIKKKINVKQSCATKSKKDENIGTTSKGWGGLKK